MYSEVVLRTFRTYQKAFQVLAALHLSSYLWPPQAVVKDGWSYDFIIVGAGTAGSVIANRLSEDPGVSVLLIEAGGDPPTETLYPYTISFMKNTTNDWSLDAKLDDKYAPKCHPSSSAKLSAGKMLGGTSSMNYHLYGRGNAKDYNTWANIVKDDTWKWENVLPYFIKSEANISPLIRDTPDMAYHGIQGNIVVSTDRRDDVLEYLDAAKEIGHNVVPDINEDHPLGYTKMLFTLGYGRRSAAALAYLSPIKDRNNLHVLKHTTVTKILIDDNKRAIGVVATTSNGNTITIRANKEVIVSAGALNTPKLLMLSGIGPKEHLRSLNINVVADLPVGQNLQDHVGVNIIEFMDNVQAKPEYPNPHENPASAVVGYVALNKTQKYPDYETMNFLVDADEAVTTLFCAYLCGYKTEICDDINKKGIGKKTVFNQVINLRPKSKGKVQLRSPNPQDPPYIHVGYFSDESDFENLVSYVLDFIQIQRSTFYRKNGITVADSPYMGCDRLDKRSREYWKCYVSCMMHGMSYFVGTCSMGSVLDGSLRVKGVHGLRVADASVMPTIPSGNINAPVVMIGEKLSDLIKQEYQLVSVPCSCPSLVYTLWGNTG